MIVSCVLFLGACGAPSNKDAPTVVTEISPVTNSGPPDSLPGADGTENIERAAALYSSIVYETNCAMGEYRSVEEKYSLGEGKIDISGDGLSKVTAAMLKIAQLRQSAIKAMIKSDWPVTVQSDIEALALFWASSQRSEIDLSESVDGGSWNKGVEIYRSKVSSSESGLSKIIRIKLGLPDFKFTECD